MRLEDYLMKKAETLAEMQTTCRYFKLDSKEKEAFYVNTAGGRGVDCITIMQQILQPIDDLYQRILYIGHRGVGKSTDLYMLQQRLSGIFEIANIDVLELWGNSIFTFSDFLCILYKQLLDKYKNHLTILDRSEYEDAMKLWHAVTEVEQVNEHGAEQVLNTEAGISIKHLLKLVASAESTLNFNNGIRERMSYVIQKNIDDYIIALNILIDSIEKAIGKPLLVIIEGIEVMPFNRDTDIFLNHGNFMQKIRLRMIITAPVALHYRTEFNTITDGNIFTSINCPMLSVTDGKQERDSVRINLLEKIVLKRVDESLIDKEALHTVILLSGGLIRDLMIMLSMAASCCMSGCITVDNIYQAFKDFRNSKFARALMVSGRIDILLEVLKQPLGVNFDVGLVDLLQNQYVLECTDAMRKIIHPAVLACLVDSEIVSAEQFEQHVGVPFMG